MNNVVDVEFDVVKNPDGKGATFKTTKTGGHCYGGSGSCSLKWITGLYGAYDPDTGRYKNWEMKPQDFCQYESAVMCLATDSQLTTHDGLAKGLKDAGFIDLGGVKSAHGRYLCHLFLKEPRTGRGDGYNKGADYHFYPNKEIYGAIEASLGGSEALKAAKKELEDAQKEARRLEAEVKGLKGELEVSKSKIAEMKVSLSEQRSLRKKARLLAGSSGAKGVRKAGAPTSDRRSKIVGMGRRVPVA